MKTNFKIKHYDIPHNLPFDHWQQDDNDLIVSNKIDKNLIVCRVPVPGHVKQIRNEITATSFVVLVRSGKTGEGEGELLHFLNQYS